jgi:hypothetical protein
MMTQNDFRNFLDVDAVKAVWIRSHAGAGPLEFSLGFSTVNKSGEVERHCLIDARGGFKRWRSLGTAFDWVRSQGWKYSVDVL